MLAKTNDVSEYFERDICYIQEINKNDDWDSPHNHAKRERDLKNQNKCSFIFQQKVTRGFRYILKPDNYIISMESQWKSIFDTMILLVIGYSCITTVLYISFDI